MKFDIGVLEKESSLKREFREDLLPDAILSLRGVDEFPPFFSAFMTNVSHNHRLFPSKSVQYFCLVLYRQLYTIATQLDIRQRVILYI
jgi:hypothetical protein